MEVTRSALRYNISSLTLVVLLACTGCGVFSAAEKDDEESTTQTQAQPQQQDTDEPHPTNQPDSPDTPFDDDEIRTVAVASVDIEAGTPLEEQHLTIREITDEFLPPNPLLEDDVIVYLGQPLDHDISEGNMLLTDDFRVADTAQGLSGRVPDGQRAVTIPRDAISGQTNLIEPGDRVDILGTLPDDDNDTVTLSLLQNVTVLAVSDRIHEHSASDEPPEGGDVTVSLTPDEAELITVAYSRGTLALLVRNREDLSTYPVQRHYYGDVIEQLEKLDARSDEYDPPEHPEGADDDINK